MVFGQVLVLLLGIPCQGRVGIPLDGGLLLRVIAGSGTLVAFFKKGKKG